MSKDTSLMEKIISWAKRRGFIFQSSEIYGGINGFFDYGPLGTELKQNIKNAWWEDVVHRRDDVVGLNCSVISHPKIWEASGHIAGFSDPMVDCKESKMRFRADQLFFSEVQINGESIGYVCVQECDDIENAIKISAEKLQKKLGKQGGLICPQIKAVSEASSEELAKIPSPITGAPGALTTPRNFNLMFQTHVGAVADDASIAYLRPETAQGTFVNFLNVVATSRVKIPFGIAQIGRSFRNEITPKNFIFRSREFEQMELEFFIEDSEDAWQKWYNYWIQERLNWHKRIGLKEDLLGFDVHKKEKLAHYSRACTDITFRYPFGVQELEGIAARGNFDLTQHQKFSGKSMEYFDENQKRRYIPHVIEPAVGVDRVLLAVICSAYHEEEVEGETRVVLKFTPRIAPIKAAVLPLVKNNSEILEKSKKVYSKLKQRFNVFYDSAGAIGRRYRRMDEIGTPFCITIDFEALENDTCTIRYRDSMLQERIPLQDLNNFMFSQCF